MAIRLYAEPHTLPLGWEVRQRLTGQKREAPYRLGSPTGPVATPELINRELAKLRGLVDVTVHIEHRVAPDSLELDDTTIHLPGLHAPPAPFSLDANTIGTAFFRELKPYVDTYRNAQGGTPGEVYATEIIIEQRPAFGVREPPRRIQPPEEKYESVIRYRDRETGKYVSADKWRRSRAAKRGAAKRSGKRAGAGRYVRVVEQRRVR